MQKNSKACWWCKNEADSREHIFKKSDLKRIYGTIPYSHKSAPIIDDGLRKRKTISPNSKFVKWEASLCSSCNNSKSSSFDKAYDEFIINLKPHFIQVIRDRHIDLKLIYGDEWKLKFSSLIRYYVKHIGCRLTYHQIKVSQNIIDFLDSNDSLRDINFYFEIRPMNKVAEETSNSMFQYNYEVLHAGKLSSMKTEVKGKKIPLHLFSWLTTSWVSFNYLIGSDVSPEGFENITNSKLPFEISPIVTTEEFNHLPTIAQKISFLEEYERVGSKEILRNYHRKFLNKKRDR